MLFAFAGFLIFTLLDGLAGGFHVAGMIGQISVWWIELAILPFAGERLAPGLVPSPLARSIFGGGRNSGRHQEGHILNER